MAWCVVHASVCHCAIADPSHLIVGFDVPEVDRDFITKKLQNEFSCSPVYLSAEVAERYYNGFSNSILWPLFHCELAAWPEYPGFDSKR